MSDSTQKSKKIDEAEEDLRSMLIEGEELVYRCEIHNAIYWKSVAVFSLAVVFAIFVAIELGVLLALVGGAMVVHVLLTKHFLMLALSNKRILARYGILQVDVVDVPFNRVESVELERMLPGHIFGYANIIITGTGQRYIRIPFAANPRAFRRAYNGLVLED